MIALCEVARGRWRVATIAMTVALWAALPCSAHNAPVPIAIWGGFPSDVAQCQRAIASSAATCGIQVWQLSNSCSKAELIGSTCDRDATAAASENAHTVALAAARTACRDVDFVSLGFPTLVDMSIDIDVFCQELQDAMISAVYGPALLGGQVQPVDERTRACILATGDAADRLLRTAFHVRRHAFGHIASAPFPPSRKFALIRRSSERVQRVQQRLQTRLSRRCPEFAALFPRAVTPYLTLVAERGDCLAGRAYSQDFVVCPDSICGNGMREPAERCDDGNTVSGDDCRADCQAVTP